MGALNWRTETVSYTTCLTKTSQTFIEFLEHLMLDYYPTQSVVLVMDNAPYHHSAQTRAALSLFQHRLLVLWLPAYCPTLNPIERFWRHLKDLALANKLFLNAEQLLVSIDHIIAAQNNPDSSLRLTFLKDFH
jgi:transposase